MKQFIILFRVLLVAAVLSLSSCGIYGKYKPEDKQGADTIQMVSYRQLLADPYLLQLVDTALVNNYDMQIAYEHIRQAEAVLLGARLAYLPSVALAPSGNYSSTTGMSYGLAQASWEIDIFGRLTNAKRQAKAALKQSEAYRQATRTQLIASVAETYYTLLMLDAEIQTCDSAEYYWLRSVETMRSMKTAGMTDEAAVAQFEGSYYATRSNGMALRLQRIKTQNAMNLLLGRQLDTVPRSYLASASLQVSLPETVDLRLVRVRPDVEAAEMGLEQAFYGTNIVRANCCPAISISGTLGWGSGLVYNAVGSLLQPLFNSGRNIAQVRGAKSRQQEAMLNYSRTLLTAGTEVNDALASYKTHRQQTEPYVQQVEALQRALYATDQKMRAGSGTYLEVLTAQNNLLSAQYSLIQNYAAILQSQVSLFHALGGGKE